MSDIYPGSQPPPPPEPATSAIIPSQLGRGRLSLGKVVAIGVVVALAAAATTLGVMRALQREASIERLVPSDTSIFFKLSIKPSRDELKAIDSILDRLPESTRNRLLPQIEDALDDIFTEVGLSYRTDVKPWVGAQAAFAADIEGALDSAPPVVGLLTVKDEDAAKAALAKLSKSGDFAFEVADGVAYVSNSRGNIDDLRSRAAAHPLSADAGYKRAIDRVGEDGLFHLWVDASGMDQALFGTLPLAGATNPGGQTALALRAEEDGIVLVGHSSGGTGVELRTGLLPLLQSTSSGLVGSFSYVDLPTPVLQVMESLGGLFPPADSSEAPPDPLGEFGQRLGLDVEDDLFAWMHGEFSVVFGGLNDQGPQVGALIEVTDETAADRTLAALLRNLPSVLAEEYETALVKPHPRGLDVVAKEFAIALRRAPGRIVVGTPPDYAASLLEPAGDALGDDEVYRRVVGSDSDATTSQLFLRIDRLATVIESFTPPEARSSYEKDIAPYLRLFRAVGMRVTTSGDETEFRMLISLN